MWQQIWRSASKREHKGYSNVHRSLRNKTLMVLSHDNNISVNNACELWRQLGSVQ